MHASLVCRPHTRQMPKLKELLNGSLLLRCYRQIGFLRAFSSSSKNSLRAFLNNHKRFRMKLPVYTTTLQEIGLERSAQRNSVATVMMIGLITQIGIVGLTTDVEARRITIGTCAVRFKRKNLK